MAVSMRFRKIAIPFLQRRNFKAPLHQVKSRTLAAMVGKVLGKTFEGTNKEVFRAAMGAIIAITEKSKDSFYETPAWRAVRYDAFKLHGAKCQCCGAGREKPLHVDHIKPRSKFPELELELSNLQILCADCNLGKMARDQTDWREAVP